MRAEALVAAHFQSGQAKALTGNLDSDLSITATGSSSQANSYLIRAGFTHVSVGGAGTGVRMPPAIAGDEFWVYNDTATDLLVYPPVGGTMNGGSANASISLQPRKCGVFKALTNLNFGGLFGSSSAGVAAVAGFSASPRGIWVGQEAPSVSTDYNNSTPSVTETYVSEIFIPCNMTITGIALFNGTDVTGNVTVGLANSLGAVIAAAKSASTAGSGTDAIQLIPFAAAYAALGPATYFIQVQYSSATARYNTHLLGSHAVLVQTGQTYGTLAAFTVPTAFVTAVGNVAGLY